MSTYGAVTISEGMQGPTLSKLGSQIESARAADVSQDPSGLFNSGQGMLILFADMRDSLSSIQQNTLETVQLLKEALVGPSQQESRDKDIREGETDPPKAKGGGRFSGALKGIGSALDKVNPFSSGFAFGNIGRALLAGGGLLLITTFRENLIGPLASLLELIKKSKLGELIKGGATDAFTTLKETFTTVVEGVTKFVEFIKATYKTIEDFLMSYDTIEKGGDASGTLDGDEIQNMITDVKDQIVESIVEFTGAVVKGVALAIIGVPLTGFAVRAISSQITPLFAGPGSGAVQGPTRPGEKLKRVSRFARGPLSLASRIALPLLVISGLLSTYDNVTQSAQEALDEQGNIDTSEFIAKFFGGKKDGGVANAFDKALSIGGTGAVVGAGLGLILGPGGALVGAMVGGMIGLTLGTVVGAVSGYLGSDKLKEAGSYITETAKTLGNGIYAEFEALVAGIAAGFRGENIADAYRMSKSKNKDYMNFEVGRAERNVAEDEAQLAKMQAKYIGPDKELKSVDYENGLLTFHDGTVKKNMGHAVMIAYRNLQDSKEQLIKAQNVASMAEKLGAEDVDLDQGFITPAHIESEKREGGGADFSYTDGIIGATGVGFSPQFDRSTLPSLSKDMGSGSGNPYFINNNVSGNKTQSDNTSIQNISTGGLTPSNQDTETQYLIASGLGRG